MTDPHAEFVRLLTQHSSQIFGFVLALCLNRTDAEDVFQNTSVTLWKKFETYQPGTNFRAWACQIAYYEVMAARRKNSRVTTLTDQAWELLAADALSAWQQQDDRREWLADCLEKLPTADRQLLEQKYFSRDSVVEIANRCARSVNSVYRGLRRIHGLLIDCMQRAQSSD
jgi:RNA polymerase sigma-70 factor, ECF subfamily